MSNTYYFWDIPEWLKDPCPYYKYGYCTAPSLDEPSDVWVNRFRCMTIQHRTCKIFMCAQNKERFSNNGRKTKSLESLNGDGGSKTLSPRRRTLF